MGHNYMTNISVVSCKFLFFFTWKYESSSASRPLEGGIEIFDETVCLELELEFSLKNCYKLVYKGLYIILHISIYITNII